MSDFEYDTSFDWDVDEYECDEYTASFDSSFDFEPEPAAVASTDIVGSFDGETAPVPEKNVDLPSAFNYGELENASIPVKSFDITIKNSVPVDEACDKTATVDYAFWYKVFKFVSELMQYSHCQVIPSVGHGETLVVSSKAPNLLIQDSVQASIPVVSTPMSLSYSAMDNIKALSLIGADCVPTSGLPLIKVWNDCALRPPDAFKMWIVHEHEIFKSAIMAQHLVPPAALASISEPNGSVPKPNYLYLVWHEGVDDSKLIC
jgi:hypothetical protein